MVLAVNKPTVLNLFSNDGVFYAERRFLPPSPRTLKISRYSCHFAFCYKTYDQPFVNPASRFFARIIFFPRKYYDKLHTVCFSLRISCISINPTYIKVMYLG